MIPGTIMHDSLPAPDTEIHQTPIIIQSDKNMNNEFWLIAAATGLVACTWLYKKGKKTYYFIRKISRSFKTVRWDPKSTLNDGQCRKLAVGAMYASQQGAYQNSMTTGIRDLLPRILGEWWGIDNYMDAHKELDYLCQKGYRYYFPFICQAFLTDDPDKQDEVFQQNMTSQEDYDKITFQFQNLEETYDELLECKVIAGKEDLKRYGVTGWDAGRICFLARACREMNYITEEEAWQYIDIAYKMTRDAFSSWHDMAMSYIIGRSLWGGKSAYNSVMKNTADKLLSSEESPWTRYAWS